jgi:hypothetical protein
MRNDDACSSRRHRHVAYDEKRGRAEAETATPAAQLLLSNLDPKRLLIGHTKG